MMTKASYTTEVIYGVSCWTDIGNLFAQVTAGNSIILDIWADVVWCVLCLAQKQNSFNMESFHLQLHCSVAIFIV